MGSVLVTGATGFIGRHLCRKLVAEGYRVRALQHVTPAANLNSVEWFPAAGLSDYEALARALNGVGTVIHLAARVHVMKEDTANPLAEFRRVNVQGTARLLEESQRAGVARFVFGSSVKAVAERSRRALTEDEIPHPSSPYGISKLEAESLVLEACEHSAMSGTVLRFPLVYGPDMKGNMLTLFKLVDLGVPLPLGSVRNRRTLLYVGNLVEAVGCVIRARTSENHVFFVGDPEPLSTPELIRKIACALEARPRLLPFPPSLLSAGGRVGDALARYGWPATATSEGTGRLLDSLVVDTSRIRHVLGFAPPSTTADGLRHTARWYRTAPT